MVRKPTPVLLLGVMILAACGGGSKSSQNAGEPSKSTPQTKSPSVVKTVAIGEKEFSLAPSSVSLTRTGTYIFKVTNNGSTTHALEIEGNGVEEETDNISPGGSATLKVALNKSGDYEMYCPIDDHKNKGMKGTITLGSGSMGGGGGTSTGETDTTGTSGGGRGPGY